MPPTRNALAYAEETRPRMCGGARRTSSAIAETVNIVEPMPPSPRSTSSWAYDCANAVASEEAATTSRPTR